MSSVVPPISPGRGTLSLVIAGICWGTGGIAGTILGTLGGLHPLSVATYRLLLGGLLFTLFLLATARVRLGRGFATLEATRRLGAVGGLLALFQVSYFAAISQTSVSVATMVTIGSVPVFVTVATAIGSRRAPSAMAVVSVGAAVLGLVLLSWPWAGSIADGYAGGVACALLAGAGFSALTLVTRRPVAGLDPLRTAAFGCLAGGLMLLPAALMLGVAVPLRAEVVAAAVYLAAVPTALAYGAYFRGLRLSHPVAAALSVLLEPLTATLLATTLLGDRLGVAGWCGAGLLIAAITLGQLGPAARD